MDPALGARLRGLHSLAVHARGSVQPIAALKVDQTRSQPLDQAAAHPCWSPESSLCARWTSLYPWDRLLVVGEKHWVPSVPISRHLECAPLCRSAEDVRTSLTADLHTAGVLPVGHPCSLPQLMFKPTSELGCLISCARVVDSMSPWL